MSYYGGRATHGMSKHPLYQLWLRMRDRCNNPRNKDWLDYGGRGIKVCDAWGSFPCFVSDMGARPVGMTLERQDNDLGYSPNNCRWASRLEQGNNKRNNAVLTWGGRTLTIANWARATGLSSRVIQARISRYGWSIDRTLSEPMRKPFYWRRRDESAQIG